MITQKMGDVYTTFEPYPTKTGLEIFVVVIPKEGMTATSSAKPFLYDSDFFLCIVGGMPKAGLAGLLQVKTSFGMATIKILRSVFA